MVTKPEVLISREGNSKFQPQIWGFRPRRSFEASFFELVTVENPRFAVGISHFDAIYHSSRDISTSGSGGLIATSGCRSFSQSFEATFFELMVIENLTVDV